jgi:hypothetical protein
MGPSIGFSLRPWTATAEVVARPSLPHLLGRGVEEISTMSAQLTSSSLRLVQETMAANSVALAPLEKAFVQPTTATTGLQTYDLEAPAKLLYPVLTPLRNKIPRIGGGRGIQANWRAITAINPGNISAGLGQGNRGGVIDQTVKEYFAAYRGIGLDNYVTFEADMSAEGFQDLKSTAVQSLLRSLMIQEERIILGGNGITGLGTTPTPSVTAIGSGGQIATGTTVQVGCVALTMEGRTNSNLTTGVPGILTRVNADGSSENYGGGAAAPSAVGSVSTVANNSSISGHVAPVVGAFAYAWYIGSGGTQRLFAITTINSFLFTAVLPTTTQLFSALSGDNSVNNLIFDGFAEIAAKAGSGAYYAAMPTGTDGVGSPLTPDGSGGIVEVDAALQSFWDNYRLSPDEMWVSSQEQNYFRRKVLQAPSGTVPLSRFTITTGQDQVRGGSSVRGYLNPFGMGQAQELPIRLHPDMPPGNIMFLSSEIPYALNDVANVYQIRTRKDYYQIEWPLRTRKYEYGCYADEVLQHYFPPSMGFITNIAPG